MNGSDDLSRTQGNAQDVPAGRGISLARLAVGIFLFAMVVAVTLGFGELEDFVAVLAAIEWKWIALATLVQLGTYVCAASVWYEVMKHGGHALALRSLVPLTIAQLFARQTVPAGGVSGAMMAARGLLNRGLGEADALVCVMVGFVSFTAAYVAAVVVALVLLAHYHDISTAWLLAGGAFTVFAVTLPCLGIWLYRRGMQARIPAALRRMPRVMKWLGRLPQVPLTSLSDIPLMLKTTLLQLAVFVFDSATLAVMLHAIGHPLPFGWAFAAHVLASATGTLAPVPLGLGTYEGAGVSLLHAAGMPVETALAAILLLRGFTFWLPMIPGFFLMRREMHYGRSR